MKRKLACILAALLLAAMPLNAYADGTTTLTTTVPAASYTLNIPADMEIPFGQIETEIGTITVSDADGFAAGKNLQVKLTYDEFTNDTVSTTIPYELKFISTDSEGSEVIIQSGDNVYFEGQKDGSLKDVFYYKNSNNTTSRPSGELICKITDWGKALAGEYSTTIIFTSEVVIR